MATKKPKNIQSVITSVQLRGEEVITGEIVSREAPDERALSLNKADVIQPIMNDAQLSIMMNKTPAWAIKQRQGPGNTYSYVPHGYVTDTLNKAFGFDWDLVIDPMADGKMYALEIEEIINRNNNTVSKVTRHVAVCGRLVVRIHDPATGDVKATITKAGFGSQIWLPGMELGDSLKGARSDLLKTCAYQLGIALDLYWNERAELADYENAQRQQVEKLEKEKRLTLLEKQGIPMNFASLLSKAKSQFGYTGEQLEKILGVDIDSIMEFDTEQVIQAWDKVVAYTPPKKKG